MTPYAFEVLATNAEKLNAIGYIIRHPPPAPLDSLGCIRDILEGRQPGSIVPPSQPNPDTDVSKLVERAFRDGVSYATIVDFVDGDLAWEQSRVRQELLALLGKAKT